MKSFIYATLLATVATIATAQQGAVVATTGSAPVNQNLNSGQLDLTGNTNRPRNTDEQFISAASTEFPDTALARPLADLNRTIVQGTVIQATLETAIQSDLPGVIRAIVSQDVRSYDGSHVLIPKGSRIFGTYRADLKLYQKRAVILWTRLITPDGLSIMIGSRGTDHLGRSGQTGFVDTHFDERFGSAALISLIGAAPVLAANAGNNANNGTAQVVSDLSGNFSDSTESIMSDYLTIQPTIYIDQGDIINVMTERDIIFPFY